MELNFNMLKEVDAIVVAFSKMRVRYAVCGGFAVAMYGFVRATKDVDVLCHPEDVLRAEDALGGLGYFRSSLPWTFKQSRICLRRWAKRANSDSELLHVFDLLVPPKDRLYWILDGASLNWGKNEKIFVVSREHLIEMKKLRNSQTDQMDISRLGRNDD